MLRLSPASPDRPLRLLLLGAHSDDIEIGCGATVLQLLALRPDTIVTWVVFSGSGDRALEARRSASSFLAAAEKPDVRILSFPESFFPAHWQAIKAAFEGLKQVEPDVVFTHHGRDLHQDHRLLSELAWNTFRDHLILEYEIPKYDGDLGAPVLFVPVPAEILARKCELIQSLFASQRPRDWFDDEVFRGIARIRGVECRAATGYAEAFHARKLVLG